MQLLLVEDDLTLGDELQQTLDQSGYQTTWAKDAESALAFLHNEHIDLIILDIGLPGMSGIDLLKNIRRHKISISVLLLTARDTVQDKVTGLDAGADDYLLKPFDLDELLARLRALIRRAHGITQNVIHYDQLQVDIDNQQVSYQGHAITISRREYTLLVKLLQNAGKILSREYLEQSIYGWNEDIESNALEVHIHHLRKKIPLNLIRTVRGRGYCIDKKKES